VQPELTEQLARLWTQSQSIVAAYVLALVRDSHLTDDIVQQVAVILVRKFEEYDPTKPFLPWVLGITKNVIAQSRVESAKSAYCFFDTRLVESIQAGFQDDIDSWASVRSALRHCLEKQTKRSLDVLRLRYTHDLKPQEIASRIGIDSGVVRVILHRARSTLRKCIQYRLRMSW
jgi:RNA polymerase sigma-70 factor, ECF subfamily